MKTREKFHKLTDKIPDDKKSAIEEGRKELEEAHKAQDLDKLDGAMEKLNNAASQDIYQAQQR